MGLFDFLKNKSKTKKTDIVNVVKSLPNLLSLTPATESQIEDAEKQLGLKFANEYKEYLAAFGSITATGIELSGIAKADYINVVSLTQESWELNPQVSHKMYVVENACVDGILIWQDSKGLIYQSKPNIKPTQIAKTLADYILNRTKN